MLKRTLPTLMLLCLTTATLLAADDPFVGKWKLNFAKSNIDRELLGNEDLGRNKYNSLLTMHQAPLRPAEQISPINSGLPHPSLFSVRMHGEWWSKIKSENKRQKTIRESVAIKQ